MPLPQSYVHDTFLVGRTILIVNGGKIVICVTCAARALGANFLTVWVLETVDLLDAYLPDAKFDKDCVVLENGTMPIAP